MSKETYICNLIDTIEDRIDDLQGFDDDMLLKFARMRFKNGHLTIDNAKKMLETELIYYYGFIRLLEAILDAKLDPAEVADDINKYIRFDDSIASTILKFVGTTFFGDVMVKHGIWEASKGVKSKSNSLYRGFTRQFLYTRV